MTMRRLEPSKEVAAAVEGRKKKVEAREKIRSLPLDSASKRWALDRLDAATDKQVDDVIKDVESLLLK